MRLLTISIAGFAALTLLAPVEASAQEDVTAPVLLDFTISPTIFDAGPGPVDITVCATAQDDLSGMNSISVRLVFPDMSSFIPLPIQETAGELIWSNCRTSTIPQFFLYGEYIVEVQLLDVLVNGRQYRTPPSDDDDLDLCAIGTCLVENLQLTALPDFDNDGVTDIADNCPNDSNPNQEDADADLIGDVCDPFPNNHDNEQAQCD